MLGLPPVKGSVLVLHPKHELPLKTAVDRIRDSITSGKFKVLVKVKGTSTFLSCLISMFLYVLVVALPVLILFLHIFIASQACPGYTVHFEKTSVP